MKRLVILLSLFCLPLLAIADTQAATPAIVQLPDWFAPIMNLLLSVPVVGPYLIQILGYISVVSALFTALATCFLTCSQAVAGIARARGFISFAQKVQAFHDKVWPWLAYLSMYNVQRNKSADLGPLPKI